MPGLRERQFNLMHILYGLGALTLLVAALSTVLEWRFARQLFAAGIVVEILVFIVSLIDIPPSEIHQPTEEIIFPPQIKEPTEELSVKETPEINSQKGSDLALILNSIDKLSSGIDELHASNKNLHASVENLKDEYREMKRTSQVLARDINSLKDQGSKQGKELKKLMKGHED